MTHALLVIDIQNDYFPGGKMELVGSPAAAKRAGELLGAFREKRLPIVHIQHLSTRPGATFFIPGTEGAEIHASVAPGEGEALFQKNFPNAFRQTALLEHLTRQGIKRLTLAGMMTHMCVDATVRAAFDHGFECRLAHDACATRALSFGGVMVPAEQVHLSFLASLNGLFARVQSANELRADL